MNGRRPVRTIDEAVHLARRACDRAVDDIARKMQTDALLTGRDPDTIDALVGEYRRLAATSIASQIAAMRSELAAWVADTPGGSRNVPDEPSPETPRGLVAPRPFSNRAS